MYNGLIYGRPDSDIDAPEAWDITTGSSSIVVAVIDSGVDYNHQDLAANMWTNPGEIPGNGIDDDLNGHIDDIYGIDVFSNDSNPMDGFGHGTHCAGTIGAVGNNGIGVAGVAWNVQIMALKFMDSNGEGGNDALAVECIYYAIAMGANILSNSWGTDLVSSGYPALEDAIETANEANILFVASAGNDDGHNNDGQYSVYPASFYNENIISVAATDQDDYIAEFSNYGPYSVDVGAPGVGIYSCLPGNSYAYLSGTSMAAPHVAGLAALVWSAFGLNNIDNIGVKYQIMYYADPLASLTDRVQSGGRINAYKALSRLTGPFIAYLGSDRGTQGQNTFLYGRNFGATQGTSSVLVNGVTASISYWSDKEIDFTIPLGVTLPANVAVTTYEGTSNCELFYDSSHGAFSDITVHSDINNQQRDPDIAMDNNGNFVVVWEDDKDGNGVYQIFASSFDVEGYDHNFSDITVNTTAKGQQLDPKIAMNPVTGNFVVVWEDDRNKNGISNIYVRGIKPDGSTFFSDRRVNNSTTGDQRNPDVAMDPASGNFVVTWANDTNLNGVYDIKARRYYANGNPNSADFTVNSVSTGQQISPAVAMNSGDSFVITWSDDKDGNGIYQVFARGFVFAGANPPTELFHDTAVNTSATGQQKKPAIAMAPNGNFVVTWENDTNNNGLFNILARGLNLSLSTVIPDFTVNSDPIGQQVDPDIAMAPNGNFVVTWENDNNNNGLHDILAGSFNASGTQNIPDFRVNYDFSGHQNNPAVSMDPIGNFVVTWGNDTNANGVFNILARGFDTAGPPCPY
ncbi:S8 family serine peptidase [Thermodesulfobacteriota bacterium]